MKIDALLIEKANTAIKEAKIITDNDQYDKVFKGYISSFGASIAQAGLIPTIIFFEVKSEQAKERPKVIEALKLMLDDEYQVDSLAEYLLTKRKDGEQSFKTEERLLLKKITTAMVAIKLALRMYKEKENKKNDNG